MEIFFIFGVVAVPLILIGLFAAYRERREKRGERQIDLRPNP